MSKEARELVLKVFEEGKIAVMTFEGLGSMKISHFITQPADGILYDLNRLEEQSLTLEREDHPRWINDFAVAKTIRALKEELDTLSDLLESRPKIWNCNTPGYVKWSKKVEETINE